MSCPRCPHCNPPKFKHGTRVRYKVHIRGRTKKPGRISSHPRAGSRLAHVVWPDAWAGWEVLSALEVVP